ADELDKVNNKIVPRMNYEIDSRALRPFLKRNDLWWMGFTGRRPNNWNIYCNYYMLVTALLSGEDQKQNQQVVDKSIRSAQYFLAAYPSDGGCDEGPSYWNMAGGTFGMFVKTLSDVSGNKLDFSAHQKIHNMGSYIHKVHIDSNYFVNFADASTLVSVDPAKVMAYGTMFNDPKLKAFAAYFFQQNWYKYKTVQADEINVFFHNLESAAILLAQQPNTPLPANSWLPDLQILTSRQSAGSSKGLFFAAKGGHNAESHNHNDVGNFVLYLDGKPVVIDIGVGTYTKDTFNENRWLIWNIRSLWHNCPLVNGIEQKNGAQFKAQKVSTTSGRQLEQFSLDLSKAYPPEAQVSQWLRNFEFDRRTQSLTITESYQLDKWLGPS
ncbi:MAG: heparinase, partial [Pedobacter sp.]